MTPISFMQRLYRHLQHWLHCRRLKPSVLFWCSLFAAIFWPHLQAQSLSDLTDAQPLLASLSSSLPFLVLTFAGYALWQWISLLLSVMVFLLGKTLLRQVLTLMIFFSTFSPTQWDQRLFQFIRTECSSVLAWILTALYVALLGFSDPVMSSVNTIIKLGVAWNIYKILYRLTDFVPTVFSWIHRSSSITIDSSIIPITEKILKVMVVVMVPLIMLQNLGVNVGSILAGLGLGGLSLALAAKDTAANLFGSLMIMLDKPFEVGDWVIIGNHEGTVMDIGLRSTRIRSFYDSIISIPNADVSKKNVDNMGKRNYRRIKTTIGITYDTPPDTVHQFIAAIKAYLQQHPKVTQDSEAHVTFTELADSSLNIMLYFFLDVRDWSEELQTRQAILLDVLKIAHSLQVSFAFPTRSLHFSAEGPSPLALPPTPSSPAPPS